MRKCYRCGKKIGKDEEVLSELVFNIYSGRISKIVDKLVGETELEDVEMVRVVKGECSTTMLCLGCVEGDKIKIKEDVFEFLMNEEENDLVSFRIGEGEDKYEYYLKISEELERCRTVKEVGKWLVKYGLVQALYDWVLGMAVVKAKNAKYVSKVQG